ncbi:N-acetyldiaminopimelate deacetylase [Chryseomicrobium sp. FSL W7-1435]|uniref:N-acetyldiaminopimelate deacetylase n=1 Tax=Chryseomicrobium sp. FSL W7-1435 TaxID=2921704 RepID=UPI00315B3980
MTHELIQLRRKFHQIPERGFEELKTKQLIEKTIETFPQQHIQLFHWKTGLVVKVNGTASTKTIAWRTDIDGLPIAEQTEVSFASEHAGFMHACGHDIHMTVALHLVKELAENPSRDDVLVFFQPAEESPGGALPMLQWVREEQPQLEPDEFYALHIAPELPVGTVSTKPGVLFANTSELYIDLFGTEGHAAFPHRTTDMSVAAAHLLVQLQSIVSRSVDPLAPSVVTIGKMNSGTVQNIISGHARLEGTIRTFDAQVMKTIQARIEAIARGIESSFDCRITIDYGSAYYQVVNDELLANTFESFAQKDGVVDFRLSNEAMTGEDFGYFIQDIPGVLFWAGAQAEYGLHHAKLNPNEAMIPIMAEFVERWIRYRSS